LWGFLFFQDFFQALNCHAVESLGEVTSDDFRGERIGCWKDRAAAHEGVADNSAGGKATAKEVVEKSGRFFRCVAGVFLAGVVEDVRKSTEFDWAVALVREENCFVGITRTVIWVGEHSSARAFVPEKGTPPNNPAGISEDVAELGEAEIVAEDIRVTLLFPYAIHFLRGEEHEFSPLLGGVIVLVIEGSLSAEFLGVNAVRWIGEKKAHGGGGERG
jgi:hypothetical protein